MEPGSTVCVMFGCRTRYHARHCSTLPNALNRDAKPGVEGGVTPASEYGDCECAVPTWRCTLHPEHPIPAQESS